MADSSPRAQFAVVADGRFLCVEITNLGAPATFSGIVQPGRGTASAAIAKPALWHHTTDAECRIDTGRSARFRIALRDRPPGANEDDDRKHLHPGEALRVDDSPRHYHASQTNPPKGGHYEGI